MSLEHQPWLGNVHVGVAELYEIRYFCHYCCFLVVYQLTKAQAIVLLEEQAETTLFLKIKKLKNKKLWSLTCS